MKTAISIPDRVFTSAEHLARRLGVSRSHLYVTALRNYLKQHRNEAVTEKLNEIYGETNSRLDPGLRRMQSRSL